MTKQKKIFTFKLDPKEKRAPVTDANQKWWQLSSIQSAGALSLPVILIGSFIASKYGMQNAMKFSMPLRLY